MQQALQETGRYQAELVDSAAQVLSRAQAAQFSAAILDYSDIKDPQIFTRALLDALPELKIIAFPPHASAEQTALADLGISNWLSMPFYLPNLLDTLQGIAFDLSDSVLDTPTDNPSALPAHAPEKPKTTRLAPEWLQDVNRVAQHLTRLSLESTAQAALITRGNQLWAYAGQLPQPAAEELARTVGHYGANSGGDLTRFIRLDTTSSDYMLYATSLGGEYVLALAFETEVSFMEMRTHAGDLARKLSNPPQDLPNLVEELTQPGDAITPQQDAAPHEPELLEHLDDELPAIPMDWRPDQDVAKGRQAFFEDLLASMDIPLDEAREFEQSSSPTVAINLAVDQQERDVALSEKKTGDALEKLSAYPEEQLVDSLMATRPTRIEASSQQIDIAKDQVDSLKISDLEPETASMVNITYTCVLIPRLPQHHLVGDLAEQLSGWVNELSLAFGWRLDHLSVRPNYLHWRAIAPADYPPARMVLDMNTQTSQRIFAEFPRFGKANPSGKFWASGHLIVNGSDKLSQQLVQDFITATRSRQGSRS